MCQNVLRVKTVNKTRLYGYRQSDTYTSESLLQELVAVGTERVARLDLTTGQCIQAWSYDMMTSWSVNWTSEQVKVGTVAYCHCY